MPLIASSKIEEKVRFLSTDWNTLLLDKVTSQLNGKGEKKLAKLLHSSLSREDGIIIDF